MNNPLSDQERQTRTRFFVLHLMRISGVILFMLGLLVIAGRVPLPTVAGWVMVVVGMFDMIVVPVLLARRWKSSPQ